MLLQLRVHGQRHADNDHHAAARTPVGPDRENDTVLKFRIEIFRKEVWRLHDMHIAIDKPEPIFHDILPETLRRAVYAHHSSAWPTRILVAIIRKAGCPR